MLTCFPDGEVTWRLYSNCARAHEQHAVVVVMVWLAAWVV